MEIISTDKRKAQKEHTCDFCRLEIAVGEIYQNQTNVYDGLYHWKSHLSCTEIARKLEMFDYSTCDEGLTGEDFREGVRKFLQSNEIVYANWADAMAKARETVLKEAHDGH